LKVQEFLVTLVLKSRHFCKLQNVSNRKNAPKSNFGPRQVTENELKNVFKDRWQIQEILPAIFHNTASTKIPAILAIIKLNNK
jgi:hypothetical protein